MTYEPTPSYMIWERSAPFKPPIVIYVDSTNITQIDPIARLGFHFSRYHSHESKYSPKTSSRLEYSNTLFRSMKFVPIIWVDENGDTRWNEAAEQEMYNYLLEKQTINATSINKTIEECLQRQFLVVEAHEAGFFSRHTVFLDQVGQTFYSPLMMFLSYRPFHVSRSDKEDFRGEGVLRYFVPMSTCAQLDRDPQMAPILQRLRGDLNGRGNITSVKDLLYENQRYLNVSFFWYNEKWAYGIESVPHRKWLFDIDRSLTPINYSLPLDILLNHSQEHIYYSPSLTSEDLGKWRSPNEPFGTPSIHMAGPSYKMTWQDRAFTSFLRYMFVLYFHHFPSRISLVVDMLAEHWSSYLLDKAGQTLDNMAAIFIRRGDKMPEDSFWLKHKRWRNISYYVKALVDEEERRNHRFSSVFVMTDDLKVMNSMIDFADPTSNGRDEPYARKNLRHRHILYNVFAPQACFNPFIRIGFDQFLVTLDFLVRYSQYTVSHTDSNVGRYLLQITYAKRQLNDSASSKSHIGGAPDTL
jgi:hypothetical protein